MKKSVKIPIIILILVFIAIGVFIWNALYGNPISESKAEKAAERYVHKQYAKTDFKIEEVLYDFKLGEYFATVVSPSSIDTHFELLITSTGKVRHDTYNDVTSGRNTYQRIDKEYMELVDEVFTKKDFPLKSDIDFGTIEQFDPTIEASFDEPDYGVELSNLKLDQAYDVRELGKTAGHIIFYEHAEDVTFEHASESILLIKQKLDEANIPFYAIDYTLEKPHEDGDTYDVDAPIIHVAHFLSDDIDENNLVELVQKAHEALKRHYDKVDAEMKD